MAPDPLILALANPNPEIMPEEATAIRPDAMICTGRSDYPNQVNNVLCFPYIFRGALDVGASTINEAMKQAAVNAIAELAREDAVRRGGPRLWRRGTRSSARTRSSPRPSTRASSCAWRRRWRRRRWTAASPRAPSPISRPMPKACSASSSARASSCARSSRRRSKAPKRVIYADGEDERVLRAAQVVLEEGIATPILIGRPAVIESRLKRYGLTIRPGTRLSTIVNPEDDPRYRDYVATYVEVAGRRGITPDAARTLVRTSTTVIAALAMRRGEADAMICGLEGRYRAKLRHIRDIIGLAPGVREFAAMSLMITSRGIVFLADTHVQADPSADAIADTVLMCARHVERFGIAPKVALVAHSDFGDFDTPSSLKMRQALQLVHERAPGLEIDGEMQADTALIEAVRNRKLPASTLKGEANLLVMPDLSSANVAYQIVKVFGEALPVGPILLGTATPGPHPDRFRHLARRRQHDGNCRCRGSDTGRRGGIRSSGKRRKRQHGKRHLSDRRRYRRHLYRCRGDRGEGPQGGGLGQVDHHQGRSLDRRHAAPSRRPSRSCREGLQPEDISLVSVSTTLATNAVVEGHGSAVGVILIGFDQAMAERTGIAKAFPGMPIAMIAGGHDHNGEEAKPLDVAALEAAIGSHAGRCLRHRLGLRGAQSGA